MKASRFLALALMGPLLVAGRAVALTCEFRTITGVSFGTYDVFSPAPYTTTGTISFRCTQTGGGATMTMTLSKGSSSTFTPRTLGSGTNVLNYNLYRDATNSQIWGDGTSGTTLFGPFDPPNATVVTLTVYGTIPPAQDAAVGSYTDTVVATMNF